ncbi:putative aarF domain-containing protein kinase, partial [Trifolium pratense]
MAMAVSGLRSGTLPLVHHHHHHHLRFPFAPPSFIKLNVHSKSKGFTLFARYAQTQDLFSSRRFQ